MKENLRNIFFYRNFRIFQSCLHFLDQKQKLISKKSQSTIRSPLYFALEGKTEKNAYLILLIEKNFKKVIL